MKWRVGAGAVSRCHDPVRGPVAFMDAAAHRRVLLWRDVAP